MHERKSARIVVGTDGSAPAQRALLWAAGEARRTGRGLQVVRTVQAGTDTTEQARGELDVAEEQARELLPAEHIEVTLVEDTPTAALLNAAKRAWLLVVGTRGRGRVGSLLLGSTSLTVAPRAACPVVVVPNVEDAPADATRPVVVGTDCSEASHAAMEFARELAGEHGVGLRVVLAWYPHAFDWKGTDEAWPASQEITEDMAAQRLNTFVAQTFPESGGVRVEHEVVEGPEADVLFRQSEQADILVVGSRGRGVGKGIALGSISQDVLIRARRPVVVVPAALSTGTAD